MSIFYKVLAFCFIPIDFFYIFLDDVTEAVKEKGGDGPKRESLFAGPRTDFNTNAITFTVAVNISADIAINLAVKVLIKLHKI